MTTEPSADTNPAWSNDGKTIYFSSNRTGTYQIWQTPAAGGAASQVTFDGGVFPAISTDPYLYFLKTWTVKTLCRIPLDGGKEEVGEAFTTLIATPHLRYFDVRFRSHSWSLSQFSHPEIVVQTTIVSLTGWTLGSDPESSRIRGRYHAR